MEDPACDSTWEEDEEDAENGEVAGAGDAGDEDADAEEARPSALQSRMTGSRNWRAMQDMCRYRHHYPDLVEGDCNGDMPNLSFYKNEIRFLPNGCFIEDILQNWKDDYDLLEDNHSYIQWLFPLREPGVNWHAKPLTLREVEEFKSCREAKERFVRAYELMLGFYGIQLEDRDTGTVHRAQNYQKRFQNLNWHSHNNLRITRVLKSLGELGFEHFQAPLARFFLEETLVRRELPGVRQSALDYFVFAVRCRRRRRELLRFAWEHFQPRCKFVWGPHDKLQRLRPSSPPHPPGGPIHEAGSQGQTCRPGRSEGGDSEAESPQPPSTEPQDVGTLERDQGDEAGAHGEDGPEPQDVGTLERDQGDEAGAHGEDGPEPLSPKESKKRKLEVNRQEQASGESGPQSSSEVEKIALNLEGCALNQGSLGEGTQEVGSQDPEEAEQPCPQTPGARVVDEVRKRRKVDEGAGDSAVVAARGGAQIQAPAWPSAPLVCSKAEEGENRVQENTEDRAKMERGAPRSPSEGPGPNIKGPMGDRRPEAGDKGAEAVDDGRAAVGDRRVEAGDEGTEAVDDGRAEAGDGRAEAGAGPPCKPGQP
ncbi:opioid growth factor receptor [Cynocephalus volans]|uniref:opioid growth factor receptor n=1 Tax=Cynocephalus volans TaxID=110931 RepID=UPI002FC861AF